MAHRTVGSMNTRWTEAPLPGFGTSTSAKMGRTSWTRRGAVRLAERRQTGGLLRAVCMNSSAGRAAAAAAKVLSVRSGVGENQAAQVPAMLTPDAEPSAKSKRSREPPLVPQNTRLFAQATVLT